MAARVRHCVECRECRTRYLIGFSPYRNGASLVSSGAGGPEAWVLYCCCRNPPASSHWVGDELKGYGELVIIRHDGGWVTAYAFASRPLVKRGDHVRQGQAIALSGRSPVTGSPLLHFEVRQGTRTVDAARLLSQRHGG